MAQNGTYTLQDAKKLTEKTLQITGTMTDASPQSGIYRFSRMLLDRTIMMLESDMMGKNRVYPKCIVDLWEQKLNFSNDNAERTGIKMKVGVQYFKAALAESSKLPLVPTEGKMEEYNKQVQTIRDYFGHAVDYVLVKEADLTEMRFLFGMLDTWYVREVANMSHLKGGKDVQAMERIKTYTTQFRTLALDQRFDGSLEPEVKKTYGWKYIN
ncbi:Uncharacterised protein [uncultured archaeon]|nr:Uncharacterised protein [uncultured archaeon]